MSSVSESTSPLLGGSDLSETPIRHTSEDVANDYGTVTTTTSLSASPDRESPVNECQTLLPTHPLLSTDPSKVPPTYTFEDDTTPTPHIIKAETGTIVRYSLPMTITLLLQYSLSASSIFVVGHLGKAELGAASLANMTAVITGYAVYQGFSTSLDTLCPQAFGSGKSRLVGLYTQRVVFLLLIISIPIVCFWLSAETVFNLILPKDEAETAVLAGQYLRIIALGAPGYACFEAGKRFVQAQGLFHASLHVLLFCAPFNAILSWFLVWRMDLGFIGAPISVALTNVLLPLLLTVYIRLITNHHEFWPPVTFKSLRTTLIYKNRQPILALGLPGILNIESEFLAWEILTLVSSYLGTAALAAQSAMYIVVCIAYQVSFSVSIGSSTRIGMLVGAGNERRAIIAAKLAMCIAVVIGILNVLAVFSFRTEIPHLFTNDEEVLKMMKVILPLAAALQIFDALNCSCNGILRGIGRPAIGSYVQCIVYYLLALPLGLTLAFVKGEGLRGIWIGMVAAMVGIALVEGFILLRIDWKRAILESEERNAMD